MIIEAHNKKFKYKLDVQAGKIFYSSEIQKKIVYTVTGQGICSFAFTSDDTYLYLLSSLENRIYCYSVNKKSGLLLAISSFTIAVNAGSQRLGVSESGLFLCVYGACESQIFSVNQVNGSLIRYTHEAALEILNTEFFK